MEFNEPIVFRLIERLIVTLCVPLLILIGYKLFVKGVSGEMALSTKGDGYSAKLTNMSPGALCFILGISLGAYVMLSDVSYEHKDRDQSSSFNALDGSSNSLLSYRIRRVYSELGIKVMQITNKTVQLMT
jgi:Mn2+/Fe2+ NRAMP family transporter